jgi:hypothetical protein
VSGAPTWPDASVNSGVAARTGKKQVAICARPQAVFVDRRPVTVNPGKPLVTADGTQITAIENVYLIWGSNGNWVRAAVNPGYIDVKVGFGQWPIAAKGLLANVRNDPNLLATRQGQVLRNPVSFEELYHSYTDSWRVSRADSMLDVCSEMGNSGQAVVRAGPRSRPRGARPGDLCQGRAEGGDAARRVHPRCRGDLPPSSRGLCADASTVHCSPAPLGTA